MPVKFFCDICDYGCCKKSSWNNHLMTSKHAKAKNGLMPANKKYACENCKMNFKHQSSYCRHKKKCIIDKNVTTIGDTILDDKELIIMLLKQNADLIKGQQDMMLKLTEIDKKIIKNISAATIIKDK